MTLPAFALNDVVDRSISLLTTLGILPIPADPRADSLLLLIHFGFLDRTTQVNAGRLRRVPAGRETKSFQRRSPDVKEMDDATILPAHSGRRAIGKGQGPTAPH